MRAEPIKRRSNCANTASTFAIISPEGVVESTLNVDVLDIQQMGGWTDLAIVKRYAGNKPINELRRLPSVAKAFGKIA